MRITRRTNIFVKTERKTAAGQQTADTLIHCGQCAGKMIPAQITHEFFGISSRTVYRLIEAGSVHFIENEAHEIYVCPASVERALETIQE